MDACLFLKTENICVDVMGITYPFKSGGEHFPFMQMKLRRSLKVLFWRILEHDRQTI